MAVVVEICPLKLRPVYSSMAARQKLSVVCMASVEMISLLRTPLIYYGKQWLMMPRYLTTMAL